MGLSQDGFHPTNIGIISAFLISIFKEKIAGYETFSWFTQ